MSRTMGPKEAQLKALGEANLAAASDAGHQAEATAAPSDAPEDAARDGGKKKAAKPAAPKVKMNNEEGDSSMRTKTSKKAAAAKARKPVKGKTTAKAASRSPQAVGDYIVAHSPTTAQLSKRFGIDPHPMRSKIFAARHELGFEIEYDREAGRYVGKAPKAKKAAK